MQEMKAVIDAVVAMMKIPFTLWGFTLNFWDIGISILVGCLIVYLIGRFFF